MKRRIAKNSFRETDSFLWNNNNTNVSNIYIIKDLVWQNYDERIFNRRKAHQYASREKKTRSSATINRGRMYLWNPREVQSRNSGGQPHTGTGGMSWWWCFQATDGDAGLEFGGQQSPHRSEVFWEGLFLVLNARPPMGADGHRFSPNSPSPLLLCLPGFFVSTLPPRLPPAPTAPAPIAGISTVLHLEKLRLPYYGYSIWKTEKIV